MTFNSTRYSLSCSFYSFCLDKLVKRFRAKFLINELSRNYLKLKSKIFRTKTGFEQSRFTSEASLCTAWAWWPWQLQGDIQRQRQRQRQRQVVIYLHIVTIATLIIITRSKWGVLVFSWSAGIMWAFIFLSSSSFPDLSHDFLFYYSSFSIRYSTLFTMPYLLVAHYHETDSIQCEDSWFLRQIRALLRSIQVILWWQHWWW